ncbi:MAG TPA: hypothetical protein VGA64_13065 [Candidatus Polarisedimenticolia bacterium]
MKDPNVAITDGTHGQRRSGGEPRRIRRAGLLVVTISTLWSADSGAQSAAPAGPPTARVSETRSGQDAFERRLHDLETQVAALRSEIDRLRSATGSGAPAIAPVDDLQRQVQALTVEIERLRIGEAAAPPAKAIVPGFGPAASKVYGVTKGVSIGGYGDMLYQNYNRTRDDGTPSNAVDTLDLDRAVLYFGYKFNDRFLFNSEVEYEHAVVAADKPQGETSVEFAYVDFKATKRFGVRGGLLLVPVGFLSELHEPPIFFGARRSEVEQRIIPSTWRENGAGVYGEAGPVSYRVYLVAGLDAAGFKPDDGIREGRQEGAGSKINDAALTARIDVTPVAGLRLGAAAFTGRTGQGDPAQPRSRLTLWEVHGEWNWRGLHARGLYARTILTDAGAVSLAIDGGGTTAIGERMTGWYGELAYNLLATVKKTDQELSLFCRYESLNTQDRVAPGFTADPANDLTVKTCGAHYRPIPNVVIKLDAQDFDNQAHTAVDQVNLALGYLF